MAKFYFKSVYACLLNFVGKQYSMEKTIVYENTTISNPKFFLIFGPTYKADMIKASIYYFNNPKKA
jgi:hypothetical protein